MDKSISVGDEVEYNNRTFTVVSLGCDRCNNVTLADKDGNEVVPATPSLITKK